MTRLRRLVAVGLALAPSGVALSWSTITGPPTVSPRRRVPALPAHGSTLTLPFDVPPFPVS